MVTDKSDVRGEAIRKGSDKIMDTFNSKVDEKIIISKTIKFKPDDDPLQRKIYFLKFVESPEMIFSQYKETCGVLIYYPKIGGGGN